MIQIECNRWSALRRARRVWVLEFKDSGLALRVIAGVLCEESELLLAAEDEGIVHGHVERPQKL